MLELNLIPIKRRLAEVTPGPWDHRAALRRLASAWTVPGSVEVSADSDFIAHASEDISRLVAEVERLRADNAALGYEIQGLLRVANAAEQLGQVLRQVLRHPGATLLPDRPCYQGEEWE